MLRRIISLALPLALAAFAGAFAQFIEQIVLARLSPVAMAATLSGGTLAGTFSVLVTATISYATVFISQYHGAGDVEQAAQSFAQGVRLAFFSLPLFLAAIPLGRFYFDCAGHAPELLAAEKTFFSWTVLGAFFTALATAFSCRFLGQGRTLPVFVANLVGCLLQMALLPLLVFGWGPVAPLGVAGAAVARMLPPFAVIVLLSGYGADDPLIKGKRRVLPFDGAMMGKLIGRGLPAGFKSFVGTAVFLAFVSVAGRLDAAALAVGSLCFAVNNLLGTAVRAIASAVGIQVGRSLGASDEPGARQSVRVGLLVCAAFAVAFYAVVIPLHSGLARTLYVVFLLRALAEGSYLVLDAALGGAGDSRFTMVAEIAVEAGVWAPAVFLVLGLAPSVPLLYLTMPLWLAVGCLVFAVRWRKGSWRRHGIL